jgi:hypothetical protein
VNQVQSLAGDATRFYAGITAKSANENVKLGVLGVLVVKISSLRYSA